MEEGTTRTLVLGDARGNDRFLRVTWHPASSTIVFSHWAGSVCTASTPVRLPDASKVIDLLVGALRDAAERSPAVEVASDRRASRFDRLLRRFGPTLAVIHRLPEELPTRRSRHGER